MKIKLLSRAAAAALSAIAPDAAERPSDETIAAAIPVAIEAYLIGGESIANIARECCGSEAAMNALAQGVLAIDPERMSQGGQGRTSAQVAAAAAIVGAIKRHAMENKLDLLWTLAIKKGDLKDAGPLADCRAVERSFVAAAAASEARVEANNAAREAKETELANQTRALAESRGTLATLAELGYGDTAESIVAHATALHQLCHSLASRLQCSIAPVDILASFEAAAIDDTADVAAAA